MRFLYDYDMSGLCALRGEWYEERKEESTLLSEGMKNQNGAYTRVWILYLDIEALRIEHMNHKTSERSVY